jgi:hypothetical protein
MSSPNDISDRIIEDKGLPQSLQLTPKPQAETWGSESYSTPTNASGDQFQNLSPPAIVRNDGSPSLLLNQRIQFPVNYEDSVVENAEANASLQAIRGRLLFGVPPEVDLGLPPNFPPPNNGDLRRVIRPRISQGVFDRPVIPAWDFHLRSPVSTAVLKFNF